MCDGFRCLLFSCWWCDNMIKRNYEMFCLSYGRLNDNDKKMR